ncbi:MAG: phycocyanobilin:ferredoxin oxidoreductase [Gemmatimonadaceae bacterium]|nr:phycocyanobilin:ferredoxin oxidoreductase [Gloeobacterales cyanobacterium ES-bin-141]
METSYFKTHHPLVDQLAGLLLSTWDQYFDLEPYALPADLGFVEGHLEGERLVISNQCFQSTVFRKLHLELASLGNGLDILHCVMFPHPNYDLPILGTDIVANPQLVSAAIIDLSPVAGEPPALSQTYLQGLEEPYRQRLGFAQLRDLPTWGNIFSSRCVFTRITDQPEAELFVGIVRAYLDFHCDQARTVAELPPQGRLNVLNGHRRYCEQQQQNDKTRRLLARAFGEEWADRYMNTVLFDLPGADARLPDSSL